MGEEKPKNKIKQNKNLGLGKFLLPWNVFSQPSYFSFSLHRTLFMNKMLGIRIRGKTGRKGQLYYYFISDPILSFKKQKMLILQKGAVDLSPLTCKC